VASIEGKCPIPEINLVFQNMVALIEDGLNLNQSYKNVLGPEPKIIFCLKVCLTISSVAPQEGLTSTVPVLRRVVKLPKTPLAKIKKRISKKIKKDGRNKPWLDVVKNVLEKRYIKRTRIKKPKIIQPVEKLTAIIAKMENAVDIINITLTNLLNLNNSKRERETKAIKPKKMAKSFQLPIRLEVIKGKILRGIIFILKIM
jgi:hypothetical protein